MSNDRTRREGKTRLVYNKETRSIDTVRTGDDRRDDEAGRIERLRRVVEAGDYLAGEVRACIGMEEPELRRLIGNTNFACLESRAEQVISALSALLPGDREEAKG